MTAKDGFPSSSQRFHQQLRPLIREITHRYERLIVSQDPIPVLRKVNGLEPWKTEAKAILGYAPQAAIHRHNQEVAASQHNRGAATDDIPVPWTVSPYGGRITTRVVIDDGTEEGAVYERTWEQPKDRRFVRSIIRSINGGRLLKRIALDLGIIAQRADGTTYYPTRDFRLMPRIPEEVDPVAAEV